MYENNEFYMQNIEAAAHKVSDVIVPFVGHVMEHIRIGASYMYETLAQAYAANKAMIISTFEELRQVCIQVCSAVAEQYRQVVEYSHARWTTAKEAALEQAVAFSRDVIVVVGPYAEAVANATRQYAREAYSYILTHPYTIT